MNTDLDSPLVVWGGRIMVLIGVFGILFPTLFFTTGINIFTGYIKGDGLLGLGAIITSVFLGIGMALVFRSNQYKKEKKMNQNSPCSSVRNTGHHEYVEFKEQIKHNDRDYNLLLPSKCKICGHQKISEYTYYGEQL